MRVRRKALAISQFVKFSKEGDLSWGAAKERDDKDSPHPIVASPCACSKHHGEFRNIGASNRSHKLCSILGNTAFLRIRPYHEATDILQEDERNVPLSTKLDEVGPFEG